MFSAVQTQNLFILGNLCHVTWLNLHDLYFESHLSDGLAISSSILAGIAMFVIATILVLETVLEICNP